MVITLTPELEATLNEMARLRGISPVALVLSTLREQLSAMAKAVEPKDQWERLVLQAATNCGASLPHAALSSEGLYD
jgi:hypothetical protein